MSLLDVDSYDFINIFYLVLFCIHVCVDVINKKKESQKILLKATDYQQDVKFVTASTTGNKSAQTRIKYSTKPILPTRLCCIKMTTIALTN